MYFLAQLGLGCSPPPSHLCSWEAATGTLLGWGEHAAAGADPTAGVLVSLPAGFSLSAFGNTEGCSRICLTNCRLVIKRLLVGKSLSLVCYFTKIRARFSLFYYSND